MGKRHRSPLRSIVELGRRLLATLLPTVENFQSPQWKKQRVLNVIANIKTHSLQPTVVPGYKISASKPQEQAPAAKKICSLRAPWLASSPNAYTVSPTEIDLFRAKAITLIRNFTRRTASLQDALIAIRQAPILPQASQGDDTNLITLQQTIQLFPGEWVTLEGSFKRDSRAKMASIPLPKTFRLISPTATLGHPLPLQHNGWALSDSLLPLLSHEANTPIFHALMQKKRRIAESLVPNGALIPQVKQLVSLKQETFRQMRAQCLPLHRQLAECLCRAAGGQPANTIAAYFHWLEECEDAFEQLSQLYQTLNDNFLAESENSETLAWIAKQDDHPARDFLALMGPLIARAFEQPFTLFWRQLQWAVCQQQLSFIEEIDLRLNQDTMHQRLLASIQSDIRCFKCDPLENIETIPQRIVAELQSTASLDSLSAGWEEWPQ